MSLVIQKFGGTSVGTILRIKEVARLIESELKLGNKIAVVISAMAGVTDNLVQLTKQLISAQNTLTNQQSDVVLASGEVISAGLLALALNEIGIKAEALQSWQIPIKTDGSFSEACILEIKTERLWELIDKDIVPVICGFQGMYENYITTLGRGGSDATAVAIAAALSADICDIYTDVDGIYSTDPNKFKNAKKIDFMDYDQVIDLGHGGAKVVYPRAAEIAKRYNVKVRVRSTFQPHSLGTTIGICEANMEKIKITAVTHKKDRALIKAVADGLPSEALKKINSLNCFVENSFWEDDVSKIVLSTTNDDLPKVIKYLGAKAFNVEANLLKITIVGFGIKRDNQIIEKIFQIVQDNGVKIVQSNVTDASITLYASGASENLTQALHDTLVK
ncbi:MAG: aspartate kinase [Candidatus Midichloriaceae bacterium]|jgi:aspartate kinase|nr:aspartate kinase [Candidatus Midichloriaceae bacterium]